MTTIYEVSKLAGVSLATVSRVINNSATVSEKTRAKVTTAMKQLNFKPNAIARSLASKRSDCVGVLVPELHGLYYGVMMGSIEAEFKSLNKHIIVTSGQAVESKEKEGIEFLISRQCDALILHVEAVSDHYLIELSKGDIPIVLINRYIEEIKDKCIYLDNELGGYLATQSLLEKGHRDILYISGPLSKSDAKYRFAGHKRALSEFGILCSPQMVYEGDYLLTGGTAGIEYFLKEGVQFTALSCANDEMATGAMTTAREHGLELPQDLSIIGFDNEVFSSYTFPKLSTVHNPIEDMGHMAARIVLKEAYEESQELLQNLFKPTVIERDSVAELPNDKK
ncbi:MAG: LacI family DNA-binding transcriptional regulator [Pseudomonadales bacterium]